LDDDQNTTFLMAHYIPLTWMTLGLDYVIWGMNPAGYHLTNLLLHAANAVLFYFMALRVLRAALPDRSTDGSLALTVGSGFATLLFAIHPLRVESVAWITERRPWPTKHEVKAAILDYIAAFFNPHRRHSSLVTSARWTTRSNALGLWRHSQGVYGIGAIPASVAVGADESAYRYFPPSGGGRGAGTCGVSRRSCGDTYVD
jgi:hypothetical protein